MLPSVIESALLKKDLEFLKGFTKQKEFHSLFPSKLHRHDINNLIHILSLNAMTKSYDKNLVNGFWKVLTLYLTPKESLPKIELSKLIPSAMFRLNKPSQTIDSLKLARFLHSLLVNFSVNATEAKAKTAIFSSNIHEEGFSADSFMLANAGSTIDQSVWANLGRQPISSKGKGRGFGLYMIAREASRLGIGLTFIQMMDRNKFQLKHLTAAVSQKLQSNLAVEMFSTVSSIIRKKNISFKPTLALLVLQPLKSFATMELTDG